MQQMTRVGHFETRKQEQQTKRILDEIVWGDIWRGMRVEVLGPRGRGGFPFHHDK